MSKLRTHRTLLLILGVAGVVGASSVGIALAEEKITTTGSGNPKVYEGELSCCQTIALGRRFEFTHILNSPPIPKAGKYLVHFSTFAVQAPAESEATTENVVCQALDPAGTENVGGVAGNGATESPKEPDRTGNGVYANVTGEGVITVANAGDHVEVKCYSSSGTGSYIAAGNVDVTEIKALVKNIEP